MLKTCTVEVAFSGPGPLLADDLLQIFARKGVEWDFLPLGGSVCDTSSFREKLLIFCLFFVRFYGNKMNKMVLVRGFPIFLLCVVFFWGGDGGGWDSDQLRES